MKKLLAVASSAFAYVLVTATMALADSGLPIEEQPPVRGTVVRPPDSGTAFTGADLGIWLVATVALVAIGLALFVVGRRRAAAIS